MPLCPIATTLSTCSCKGISSTSRTYSSDGIPEAVKRSRTCTQQLPKPISSACNCIIIEAMEASSIHTSLTNGSAVTTIANGASAINCDACALQCDSFSSNSLSSTIINCHAFVRLEVGDISAAFIRVTTSSCVNSPSVNFRILRRTFSNSLKFSIYHILLVTYLAHCAK